MGKFPKPPTVLLRSGIDLDMFEGLISECDKLGWRVINLMYTSDYVPSVQPIVGAVIATPPQDSTIDQLREQGVPIICTTFRDLNDFEHDGCILEDRPAAGRLAADAFTERGFRNLAYVDFDNSLPLDRAFAGFQEQSEQVHGATVKRCTFSVPKVYGGDKSDFHNEIGELSEWLKTVPMPLGLFAINHRMGVRMLAACEAAGLQVPEQVGIISRGSPDAMSRMATVPLSSIDTNREEVGRRSIQLLKSIEDGNALPQDPIYISPRGFIERRSTDIMAVADARVAKAMRFMWDHLDWPLTVDDVVREQSMSRITLERAFRRTLGRGINAELRRKRMEVCKGLLRGTNMTITEIAKKIGLSNRRHVHRTFKKVFGLTPKEYRNQRNSSAS